MHAHQRGIAAGSAHRVAHDHVVVLLPDPATRTQVWALDHGQQGRAGVHRGRNRVRADHFARRRCRPGALVFGGSGDQRRHGNVGGDLSLPHQYQPLAIVCLADDGEIQFPLLEDRARLVLTTRLEDHEHALLALRQHQLERLHAGLAHGHVVEHHGDADFTLAGHLHGRRCEAGCAHVLNGHDGVSGHKFEAGFQQKFFGEGVTDLHGRTLLGGIVVELGRGHGRAVNAVAPGLGADIDDRQAGARSGGIENLVGIGDPHGHGIDQDVAVIGGVEVDLTADGRHADAVTVAANARHYAINEVARLGVVG